MIIDTHAHYDDKKYEDVDYILNYVKDNGVELIVEASFDIESCKNTLEMVKKYSFVYGMLGFHPDYASSLTDEDLKNIYDNCNNKKIVAIGEIGLDYREDVDKLIQKKCFLKFLQIAKLLKLPVNIHSRNAEEDTFTILNNEYKDIKDKKNGIIHCFSYSKYMAKKFIDLGFYIGIGGIITFKKSDLLKDVVLNTDINDIVLETDCPYLAPAPNRGKVNNSSYLKYVVQKISEIKKIDYDVVINITNKNAKIVYNL